MIDLEATRKRNQELLKPVQKETPLSNSESGVMNLKGSTYMDLGYFYAPYVTKMEPVVIDELPTKGILTRYGRKLLEEGKKFYSKIELSSDPLNGQNDCECPDDGKSQES